MLEDNGHKLSAFKACKLVSLADENDHSEMERERKNVNNVCKELRECKWDLEAAPEIGMLRELAKDWGFKIKVRRCGLTSG